MRTKEKLLFLTFDDGPVPEVTPKVLDLLLAYHAKATFFCIGQNIALHPGIYQRIRNEGHGTGNHTYNHKSGWKSSTEDYLVDTQRCQELIEPGAPGFPRTPLFRPPYGKITLPQYLSLKDSYRIVMWDVLTRDWESDRSSGSCFLRIQKKARPGSIVVFHDSIKAQTRMIPALQMTLEYFSESGYSFESLDKHL